MAPKSLTLFLTLFLFLITLSVQAQLEAHEIDGEGWVKGDFVEIGINQRGVYGARKPNKPLTFHENREFSNQLFGFIANPLKDGWVDYDGDYFSPGDPEEGFSIEINGVNYSNNNQPDYFQIPGEVKGVNLLSSDCFEDSAQIYWEGNIDGLNIKRYYTVTKDGLFIQMTTVIKNISDETKNDVYFMHNVDPDNNVTLSGLYETDLSLISQASSPTDNVCLVTASQEALNIPEDMDGSHLSFYARNDRARVTFGGFTNRSASTIWNASSSELSNTEGDSVNFQDMAISIAFKLEDIEPNEVEKFTYYYILEEVDETFTPFIVSAFKENPTTCSGTDGKITFSGLVEGDPYTISYFDNGVFIPEQTLIANSDGEVILEDLDQGTYSNIKITFAGCDTFVDTVFELEDPEVPNYTFSKEDLENCEDIDGSITLHGLTPYTNYSVSYSHDGTPVGPVILRADFSGNILLPNLNRGFYTNFALEQYECVTTSPEIIEIGGPAIPTPHNIPDQFYCDEDYDYVTTIDLSDLDTHILGPDDALDFEITYHLSENDVHNNVSISKTSYTTSGEQTYTLYAKKRDIVDSCYDFTAFDITINLPPSFEVEDVLLCLNSDDTTNYNYTLPILKTGLSITEHSFEWYHEGELIVGQTSNELTVDAIGNYSVTATLLATGCDVTEQAVVHPSGPPKSLEVTITSDPFSENHVVEVIAQGHGDYVYSIDTQDFQTSPIFSGISPGYHEFHIIDLNGCGIVTVEKMIIDYMKFFTPNNDGYNDHWQIIGISELKNPVIRIFDRYGKLLKSLHPNSKGWDGTYNGSLMPSSDYWFIISFEDDNGVKKEFKSHFSLKR